jgi:ABC-2 type transport system ATP-binding protein
MLVRAIETAPALIEAEGLVKSFGGRRVVDGVSFRVPVGCIVGLLGQNGAGKTTAMRLLSGSLLPDAGRAEIAGHDVRSAPLAARASLGYLPEAASGFSDLTCREFLGYCAEARGLWGRARNGAVARVAETLNAGAVLDQRLGTLSKGWRQRAWLVQALLHEPPALLLDEPTDGLDPIQKIELRRFLRTIAAERAILMSTHILEEAEALCDRLIIIRDGQVVADASREALLDRSGRLGAVFERLTTAEPPTATTG